MDKVHDLMDDVNEQQELADEIANAISMPTGTNQFDDDELLRELELLTVSLFEHYCLFHLWRIRRTYLA